MDYSEILEAAKNGDTELIDQLLPVVLHRKRELYPDYEIAYLAAPKVSKEEEKRRWEAVLKVLRGLL